MATNEDDLQGLKRELAEADLDLSRAIQLHDRLVRKLVEAENLAAVGRLVAGFAHEMNTPLGIAVTAGSTLRERIKQFRGLLEGDEEEVDEEQILQLSDEIQEAVDLCMENVLRVSKLVTRFRELSLSQVAGRKQHFSVLEVIRDTAQSLRMVLGEQGVELEVRTEEDVELFNAPGALSQALNNLVLSAARYAYPPGREYEQKSIVIETWRLDELYLIEVRDFGVGIDAEKRDKVFDPFGMEGGTGLTLTQNIIVGLYGGTIECDCEAGKGTTFSIRFPVRDE